MRKFDTKVQHLKYKVLREVARHAWNGNLLEHIHTLGFECCFPGLVQSGKQHGRQNSDNGDHHQKFDQCKRAFHFNPFC